VIQNFSDQGIKFYITNPIGPVRDVIKTSALHDYMYGSSMFSTISDAILFIDDGVDNHAAVALQTND